MQMAHADVKHYPPMSFDYVIVDNMKLDGNTLSSTSGTLNINPVAGKPVLVDSTVAMDAGVVTGITNATMTVVTVTTANITNMGSDTDAKNYNLSNADVNSGTIDGVQVAASSATTLNFSNIKINPAAAVGTVEIGTANRCVTVNVSGSSYKMLLYQ
jgi:hypothetical protein